MSCIELAHNWSFVLMVFHKHFAGKPRSDVVLECISLLVLSEKSISAHTFVSAYCLEERCHDFMVSCAH
jgi:hypothetical protein